MEIDIMQTSYGNAVISLITNANANDAKRYHEALHQFINWDDVKQHYPYCSLEQEMVYGKLKEQACFETIDVIINEEGDVLLNDEYHSCAHQWVRDGQCTTGKVLAIEPTPQQFALLSDLPGSANGDLGMYLTYWDNYMMPNLAEILS